MALVVLVEGRGGCHLTMPLLFYIFVVERLRQRVPRAFSATSARLFETTLAESEFLMQSKHNGRGHVGRRRFEVWDQTLNFYFLTTRTLIRCSECSANEAELSRCGACVERKSR